MATTSQSARRVFWSPTPITDGVFTNAVELGTLAPGAEIGSVEPTLAGPAFGFSPEVGGEISPFTVLVFGTAVEADLTTAKDAVPPTYGYLLVANANLGGYSWYHVHPTQARIVPRGTERQKPMVAYGFYGEGDAPEELAGNYDVAVTFA
ncbi:MAG: hypothetical protein CMM84_16115 [Rhodothermaceae bacterium]|nr:hypothetical protein [Rhodothermaceae bacterium]MBC12530.1 hypothetical protein [Rhodothermaceae bacterium]